MTLLKKHWQKFIIASFSSFWASCSDSESTAQPVYDEPSSSSDATTSSSSETTPGSSSEMVPASSDSRNEIRPLSSSSIPLIVPMYGVMQGPLQPQACKPSVVESYSIPPCHDEICPDYGVEIVKTEGCDCSDGSFYTLEQFSDLFNVDADAARECNPNGAAEQNNSREDNSSSSMGIDEPPFVKDTAFIDQPAVYGPPCFFNGTCNDVPSTEEKE
ncbi:MULTISPECIES: hypothetical protein [unclassified Fibrobacter]|uniref:hypothetical protein n=1 Tax=unclassified Fibrobacter TaxID=2634177 RepID=UPI000D7B7F03|nr:MULTISPECIES: hypothetical protein [unclassified Fibrobacter]PWJ71975.1 hypothetical protein BGX12_101214 [Fibrobacter sp. UWR4]PZW70425.1 hypothetical protein C8E88_101282 [Fibrobacter sp. UWR1]